MKRTAGCLLLAGALSLSACSTINPYTGEKQTSKAAGGAAIGAVSGALIGIAGAPAQVRNHEAAGMETRDGPFMSCDLPIAGFAVIEAASLEEAIEKVSQVPCAVAHGGVEVWPLK